MTAKVCRECKRRKPLASFYKHAQMSDGHLNKCKDCVKQRVSKHRESNIEFFREYDRNRGRTEARKKDVLERQKSEYGKAVREGTRANALYRDRNPEKTAAHNAVARAIKAGKLIRGACQKCGSTKNVHGHHKDYKRKLDVTWLCAVCHGKEHRIYV
jgi:hypothetical protein